ncbi:DNAH6 [Scenedesmus sp. PABB004]|nr:DNAH6 [Scenedesmus sp. PABB004]
MPDGVDGAALRRGLYLQRTKTPPQDGDGQPRLVTQQRQQGQQQQPALLPGALRLARPPALVEPAHAAAPAAPQQPQRLLQAGLAAGRAPQQLFQHASQPREIRAREQQRPPAALLAGIASSAAPAAAAPAAAVAPPPPPPGAPGGAAGARAEVLAALVSSMRAHPEAAEFVYLRPAALGAVPPEPFDLAVCSHAQAAAAGRHLTMSPAGVTEYAADGAPPEFVSLETFQREWLLHTQLVRLPVFRNFRRWKALAVWRRAVRSARTSDSAARLQAGLFALQPVLADALRSVRAACLEVEGQQLCCLEAGRPTTLEGFAEAHTARLAAAQEQLVGVAARVVATATAACEGAVAALEQQLVGAAPAAGPDAALASLRRTSAASDADARAATPARRAGAAAAGGGGGAIRPGTDSFTMQAAKRSERRRLAAFVGLLDCMLADAVHSAVAGSLRVMHAALSGCAPAGGGAGTGAAEPAAAPAGGASGAHAVLQLEVLLEPRRDALLLSPAPRAFDDALAAWLRGVVALARGVPCLTAHPALRGLIEAPPDGGRGAAEGRLPSLLGADFEAAGDALASALARGLAAAERCAGGFERFRAMVAASRGFSADAVAADVAAGRLGLEGLRGLLVSSRQQLADVEAIPPTMSVGVLEVGLGQLAAALRPSPARCLEELARLLPRLAAGACTRFVARVRGLREAIAAPPGSPDEFVAHVSLLAEVEAARPGLDAEFDAVSAHYDLLAEFGVPAPEEEVAAARCVELDYAALRDAAWAADAARDRHAAAFLSQLQAQGDALAREVSALRLAEQDEGLLREAADVDAVIAATGALMAQVAAHQATAARISGLAVRCGGAPLALAELEALAEDVELKHLLWSAQRDWAAATADWLAAPFFELDVLAMQDTVDRLSRQAHRLERGLPPNALVPRLRESAMLGPVMHLHNPQLRERHWAAVADLLGRHVDRSPGAATSVATLLDMQVLDHTERIAAISNEATQEAALEALLAQVADKWRGVELSVRQFRGLKDTFILGEVDDVLQVAEDSRITLATIASSRYVGGIKPEVDRLDRQLRLFSATLEAWLAVQAGWLSLEPVLSAPDITRQLPGEAAAFAGVDRTFKDCGTTPGRLEALTACAGTLEAVAKGLEDYLDSKRAAWPRFYFLSNQELLDILRQAKAPAAVQPHLPKCFDGLARLELGDPPGGAPAAPHDVVAMLSAEGERVPFSRPVKVRRPGAPAMAGRAGGPPCAAAPAHAAAPPAHARAQARGLVESWLASVEANMRLTLRAATKRALHDYGAAGRAGWALAQPAQLAVLAANVHWCAAVEAALGGGAPGAPGGAGAAAQLQALAARCVVQLEELTELVRGPLTDLERKSVVGLITSDVHARDVVAALMAARVAAASEFDWQLQLRFEYDADADTVHVRQLSARFDYGYEYLGAAPRLVITPVTERAFVTLTGALHMRLGGAPAGPAGTGKTETVKDLGKALGVQCVVFNCGEGLDHRFTARVFSGLAQCGAWACLDEFNRLELEVLSVVAQQLSALQAALRGGLGRLLFEGREMPLQRGAGVFVTMNPGGGAYGGRHDLPDNLRVLLRPVAMMLPDHALIAEVLLFAEGFTAAPWLARKVVAAYGLAGEQLSQQAHYDFGMRALKAVLAMAGEARRGARGAAEEHVILDALRGANLPKLLSEDAALFEAILGDLFPGAQPPRRDQAGLRAALAGAAGALGLQAHPALLGKAVELHDTLGARFGVMLVGPPGGGKSACRSCLRAAETALGRAAAPGGAPNQAADGGGMPGYSVHEHVLNPKSITLAQLFGAYSAVTHDWADGLLPRLVRGAVADVSPDVHWLVCDGPVDSLWVENLNTVLDDNRMLCLPNGERIKLDGRRLRVLFEVEDLAHASPATVSRRGGGARARGAAGGARRADAERRGRDRRCGMVYVPAHTVGWRPFVRSWLDRLLARAAGAAADGDGSAAAAAPGPSLAPEVAVGLEPASVGGSTQQQLPVQCPEALAHVRDFFWGLFEAHVPPLLEWVAERGTTLLPAVPVAQLAAVTTLFESQADALRGAGLFDPALDERQRVLLQYVFAHAAVWGVGGGLAAGCWDGWDGAVRAAFDGIANFPAGAGSVFDYCLDPAPDGSSVCFVPWERRVPAFTFRPAEPSHDIMVPTADTVRYGTLLQAAMAAGRPALLVGGGGVGKTAIVKARVEALRAARGGRVECVTLHCCAHTSAAAAQGLLEGALARRGARQLGPPAGQALVVFVDDLNLPQRQATGAQPPLEMLRLLLDRGGMFAGRSLEWREVVDTVLVGACGPPGSGRHEMSGRLTRHMLTLAVPPPSEVGLRRICTAVLGGFLDAHFTPDVRSRLLRPLVEATVELYGAASAALLPTPSRSHYLFSFRDVAAGVLSIRPAQCGGCPTAVLTRLWAHEVQRVFGDRLVCRDDRDWLAGQQQRLLVSQFGWQPPPADGAADGAAAPPPGADGVASAGLFGGDAPLLFGDFGRPGVPRRERAYEQLPGVPQLAALLARCQEEYNAARGTAASAALAAAAAAAAGRRPGGAAGAAAAAAPVGGCCRLDLVFFRDAVLHVVRLARVLRRPRGSALLVGVGGSGKQSLMRFTARLADCEVFTPAAGAGYGLAAFREEVKGLYRGSLRRRAAPTAPAPPLRPAPGLFTPDEQAALLDQARPWLAGLPELGEGRQAAWAALVGRVRHHLHLVFATSPVGDAFRVRCRDFPALVACTTVDWFDPWPEEALLGMGVRFLELGLEQQPAVAAPPPGVAPAPAAPAAPAAVRPGGGDAPAAPAPCLVGCVAALCVEVHRSVEAAAERFHAQLKRRVYVTPKLYLDLLSQFGSLLAAAREELGDRRRRLLSGIAKLAEANASLDQMRAQLAGLQPLLTDKTAATSALLKQARGAIGTRGGARASRASPDAPRRSPAPTRTHARALSWCGLRARARAPRSPHGRAAAAAALRLTRRAPQAAVLPALESAVAALDALNKADIIEMRTFIKPPPLVQLTMEGVCTLLQEKTDWDAAKRVLGSDGFVARLTCYDKDRISDRVGRQSRAAQSMCLWVRAMDTYAGVFRVVEPKRQALAAAQAALDASNAALADKRAQLSATRAKVSGLQGQLAETQRELASLQFQADLCGKRLGRAGRLTSLLGDELVRWGAAADGLGARLGLLLGDTLLAAAAVNYLGPFTGPFRAELVARWHARCQAVALPVTAPGFSLPAVLSSPVELLEWGAHGLPRDATSVDSALIATRGRRWPLMIDPQHQASRWVRAKEAGAGLVVVRAGDPTLLRQLEVAVRLGQPVLLEGIGEAGPPPGLEALLLRQVDTQVGRSVVVLGEREVEYGPGFRLYMACCALPNPHLLPEVAARVNVVNFGVTREALEEQLLADLVRAERPELEEARVSLTRSIADDTRALDEAEARTLRLLREASGSLLDDEALIGALSAAKATAGVIAGRVREAEATEAAIHAARRQYTGPPAAVARSWFVVADLPALSPMYATSLATVAATFRRCVAAAPAAPTLEARMGALSAYAVARIHRSVARRLFSQHRLAFAFALAAATQRDEGRLPVAEWDFLLRGSRAAVAAASPPAGGPGAPQRPACVDSWRQLLLAGGVEDFAGAGGLLDRLAAAAGLGGQQPVAEPAAQASARGAAAHARLTPFQRLLLVKVAREELLGGAMAEFVAGALGAGFVSPPTGGLAELHSESGPGTPVVLVLAPGADALAELARFASAEHGRALGRGLATVSLGQGQGPVAAALVRAAMRSGDWVCVQNCHLAPSWMPALAALVESLEAAAGAADAAVHPDFRLWLTSAPADCFPASVLQRSVVAALEPPRGLRASLAASYAALPPGCLAAGALGGRARAWQLLVFAGALLHGLLQERRRFGALGWSSPYEFVQADLGCALAHVQALLQAGDLDGDGDADGGGWRGLRFLVAQACYGGRVTDASDRRLLGIITARLLGPDALRDAGLLGGGATGAPPLVAPLCDSVPSALAALAALPISDDDPRLFGLHPNASIALRRQEGRALVEEVLAMAPRLCDSGARAGAAPGGPAAEPGGEPAAAAAAAAASAPSAEAVAAGRAAEMLAGLPAPLARRDASVLRDPFGALPGGRVNSLGVVLLQEMHRYNALLGVVRGSLAGLQAALAGRAVLGGEAEASLAAITDHKVPPAWAAAAYPSGKPLASWLADLARRVAFVRAWLTTGQPASFWLPGLFFPQAFLTGVLQAAARGSGTPVDRLAFGFRLLPDAAGPADVAAPPAAGVYVHGLLLEAARLDGAAGCLADPAPGEMSSALPVLHLLPRDTAPEPEGGAAAPGAGAAAAAVARARRLSQLGGGAPAPTYACPLFRTPARGGALLHLELPVRAAGDAEAWALRGAAALCALDD